MVTNTEQKACLVFKPLRWYRVEIMRQRASDGLDIWTGLAPTATHHKPTTTHPICLRTARQIRDALVKIAIVMMRDRDHVKRWRCSTKKKLS